jgi:hypothetical protein
MDRTYTVVANYGAGIIQPVITGLPAQGRLGPNYFKRIQGRLHLVVLAAAVADALPGRRMMEAIQNFLLSPVQGIPLVNNLLGSSIRFLQWSITGKAPVDPSDVPANGNATFTVDIPFVLDFFDRRSISPKDGGVPCPFVSNGQLGITWAGSAAFGTGLTIQAGTKLYLDLVYGERSHVQVGERVTYEQVGVTTWQNFPMAPGQLTDSLLVPLDGSAGKAFTENSIAQLAMNEDGDPIHNQTIPDDLIGAFNTEMVDANASNLPTLDQPQTELIPLIWPGRKNSSYSDRAYAVNAFSVLAVLGSGNPPTNNYLVINRRILPADNQDAAAQVHAAAPDVSIGSAQLGLAVAAQAPADAAHSIVHVATHSKVPIMAAGNEGSVYARFGSRRVNATNLKAAALAAASKQPAK